MQLGSLGLSIEAHLGDDLLGVHRRVLHGQEPGVCLQGALVAVFLTEHRSGGQGQLQHIPGGVVLKHHSQALLVAASAAIALARTRRVLRTVHASHRLLVLSSGVRALTIIAPAIRPGDVVCVIGLGVEDAAHLGGGFHDDDVHVAFINGRDLFAACYQAEHTTFDGDAFDAGDVAAREGFGGVGQLVVTGECGNICGGEKCDIGHDGQEGLVMTT